MASPSSKTSTAPTASWCAASACAATRCATATWSSIGQHEILYVDEQCGEHLVDTHDDLPRVDVNAANEDADEDAAIAKTRPARAEIARRSRRQEEGARARELTRLFSISSLKLAAATREQIDQAPEQAGTKAIDLHRVARAAGLTAHFREHVRRQIDTKFADWQLCRYAFSNDSAR